jgi:hypothetical protein
VVRENGTEFDWKIMESFASIIKILERLLPPIYHFWIAITVVSGLLLFLPAEYLVNFHVEGIYNKNKGLVSLCFMVSFLLVLIPILFSFFKYIKRTVRFHQQEKVDSSNLTFEEMAVLRFFVMNNYGDTFLDSSYQVILRLKERNFIYAKSSIGHINGQFLCKDAHEIISLTNLGRRKLESDRIKNNISNLDNEVVLSFIKKISPITTRRVP